MVRCSKDGNRMVMRDVVERWFKVGLGIEDIGVLDLEIEGC